MSIFGKGVDLLRIKKEEVSIMKMAVFLLLLTSPIFGFKITIFIGKIFWSLLTPGQKILEITMIICCIGIMSLFKLIADILTTNIFKKINYLKEQNDENIERIVELEKICGDLKTSNTTLEETNTMLEETNTTLEETNTTLEETNTMLDENCPKLEKK